MSAPAERSPFSIESYLNGGQQSPLERYLNISSEISPNISFAGITRGNQDASLMKKMIQDQLKAMNFAELASSPLLTSEPLTLSDLIKSETQKEMIKLLSRGQLRDPNCKCCFRICPCKLNGSTPSSGVPVLREPSSGRESQANPTVTDQQVFEKKNPDHRRFMTICRNEVNMHGVNSFKDNPVIMQESIKGIIRKMPGQLADTPRTKEKIAFRIKRCLVEKKRYGNKKAEAKKMGVSVKRLKSTFASIGKKSNKKVTDPLPRMPPTPTGSDNEVSDIEDAMVDPTEEVPSEKPSEKSTEDKSGQEKSDAVSKPRENSNETDVNTNRNSSIESQESQDSVPAGVPAEDTLHNKYGLDLNVGDIVALVKTASNYDVGKIRRVLEKKKKIEVLFMKVRSDKSLKEPKGGYALEKCHMNAAVFKFSGTFISEEEHLSIKAKCGKICNPGK